MDFYGFLDEEEESEIESTVKKKKNTQCIVM